MSTLGTVHPTKKRLVDATVSLMNRLGAEGVTADSVLAESGVSRGSMYHHFDDLADLLDHADAERYSSYVDASIGLLAEVLTTSDTKQQLLEGLRRVTLVTQSPASASNRSDRLRILARASQRPHLSLLLASHQQRLTDAIAELVRGAQARGWYRPELKPEVVAVFIQAYTLGKIVDDISERPMEPDDWEAFIMSVIETLLVSA